MTSVKIKKISREVAKTKDVTVNNNHNFFANGFLIHNCNFRGELEILVANLSSERLEIQEGQKIAQGLFVPIGLFDIQVVSQISTDTDRGANGFGSTGV